ncbi:MAG: site-2 protease family protein, partial [Deltaproteobacteria bacterium]|nr:site-2 protease family protein [Kofleriaceae bacterium]
MAPPAPARVPRSRWSWRLGAPFGIDVFVHASFLLLVAWIAIGQLLAGHGVGAALEGIGFIVAVFAFVVLHELGHARAALRFGCRTRSITLLPIGGIARLERMPERPRHELVIALAGPAVNVALAALLAGVLVAGGLPLAPDALTAEHGQLLARLFWVNVTLAVFNLLPAFPMDGGRVLRALIALRAAPARATEIAAWVGKLFAVGFILLGIWFNPFLLLIGAFVWLGADVEVRGVQLRAAITGVPVRQAMISRVTFVDPQTPLARVAELLVAGHPAPFPVVDAGEGGVLGVVSEAEVTRGLATAGPETPASAVMRPVASVPVT